MKEVRYSFYFLLSFSDQIFNIQFVVSNPVTQLSCIYINLVFSSGKYPRVTRHCHYTPTCHVREREEANIQICPYQVGIL